MTVLGRILLIALTVSCTLARAVDFSVSPSTIPAGGAITATWSGITNPTQTDWIGLYAPDAVDKAYLAFRYTSGSADGNVPFDIPLAVAPGTYQLRLFANNGYTRLATSANFTVTAAPPPAISVSPTTVPAGGSVTATWTDMPNPGVTDWIGLYVSGQPVSAYLAWRYTTGTRDGSVPLDIPAGLSGGAYELRLIAPGGIVRAVSGPFAVVEAPPPTISASPATVGAGNPLTATWSGITGPTATDWIGLYSPSAADNAFIAFRYTTGAAGGNVPFDVPASATPGPYQLRLFASDGYTRLATSPDFTVTGPPPPAISAAPTSVEPGGSVAATWSGISNPTPNHWIGLYLPGTPIASYLAWRYTTGTASGNVPFDIPSGLAPNTYELRLVAPGQVSLATSNSFAVMVPRTYFIHPDHLNTPRLVADSTGTSVWRWDQQEPFGVNVPDENPSGLGAFEFPLRLPGQYADTETGLHYNYFRDYDVSLGRYVESDPIGLAGGLDLYAYVGGNPIGLSDPLGLDPYLIGRPLAGVLGSVGVGHLFVVTGAAYLGDPEARVFSFGRMSGGGTGPVNESTTGFSAGTSDRDKSFWRELGAKSCSVYSPFSSRIPATDQAVLDSINALVSNRIYAVGSINSNSSSSAIANRAAGGSVAIPSAGVYPGSPFGYTLRFRR